MTEKEVLTATDEWLKNLKNLLSSVSSENQEYVQSRIELLERLRKQAERVHEFEKQNKRYKQALEYIQREIREAIYTPKNNKWNSDFEREFESGRTRGLIQASDIMKESIEILEGEE